MALSLIEQLKKAASLKPSKRTVVLTNGHVIEFHCAPLTMAERQKAQKDAKNDDTSEIALQLLVNKACDQNGEKCFNLSHIPELKHMCKEQDVQALMVAVMQEPEVEEAAAPTDMKRTRKAVTEG